MDTKKERAQLPFRLNILFIIVFLLFSLLILQLGVVQILEGASYQEEIDRTVEDTTKIPVPRGKILDRNHNILTDNKPLYSITYTPPKGVQAEDKLKVATELAKYIDIDKDQIDKVNKQNKKEYWYLIQSEEVQEEAFERLTEEELKELNDADQYQEVIKRIPDDLVEDFSDEEMKIMAIKRELDKAYALTPQVIKNKGVTAEEYAKVSEHLHLLNGINATTDWDRDYPYDSMFSSFLGTITTQEQGIPKEQESHYLSKGYSRNDRVGRSGLEDYYEEVLKGRKEQIKYTMTKTGKILESDVVVEGERGKDLILTVDMDFQKKVDKVVEEELKKTIQANEQNRFLSEYIDALAVVMNPKTGEILALSGKNYDKEKGEVVDVAHKTVYDAHIPGSSIKGATVAAGFQSEVVSPGTVINDTPIKIGDTIKGSWMPLGQVNDIDALQKSSNVYMFHIAMRMGGEFNYYYGKRINFNREGFGKMRNYFNQFGLGIETGIDLPFEATGYEGDEREANPGNLQDLAIGQYDTYTTLQLAQYISTIANDGYRVKPHLVKEIREPSSSEDELGPIYKTYSSEVLNKINNTDEEISRIQEGLKRVFQGAGGTGYSEWQGKSYNPAGKTGTAENEIYIDGRRVVTENLALVGYAPFDDPEVAFAVIIPNLGKVSGQHPINHRIGKGIMDAYFDL